MARTRKFFKPSLMLRIALVCAVASFAFAAQAEDYPTRPVRFVVPYPPGGTADSFARALGADLSLRLGQPVVMENKPGASMIIGTNLVAKSAPDGYTIGLGSVSALALNLSAFKKLPYDPVKDFAPVSLAFDTPLLLMVAPSLPVKSVKDLIAYAKSHPGALSFASLGYGTSLHIAGELFNKLAGLNLLHVPYKGTTTTIPDLMEGRVSMIFDGGALLSLAQQGKVRMLAVTTHNRLDSLPDVPTMEEAGVPGYQLDFWFGIVAPAGTPRPIVQRLAHEIADIERQPAFRQRLVGFPALQIETSTPQEMAATIKHDIELWHGMFHDLNIEPQ